MNIHIITVFPELFRSPFNESIIKRAQDKNLVKLFIYNLRDFTDDKHHQVDDYPYGGGPGMILKPEPIFRCLEHVLARISQTENRKLIYLTPQGKKFVQHEAIELTKTENLILLCGHYKGIDQRARDYWQFDEVSIGDYVLSGGEIPALVIIDALIRLIPGVISDINSATTDSFYNNNLLDCPYYTRPEVFRGMEVPAILLSGNHAEIAKWRRKQAVEITYKRRKDLLSEEHLREITQDDLGGLSDEQS